MVFNVTLKAETIDYFKQDFWLFCDKDITKAHQQRLKLALTELVSGFNSDTPLLLTDLSEETAKPRIGQFVKDVFWTAPEDFRFGEYMVTNTNFLMKCFDKYSLVESFALIGELVDDDEVLSERLAEWDSLHGLCCFTVCLEEGA